MGFAWRKGPPKVVFSSGGSSGIGKAMALRLAREGASVAIFSRKAMKYRSMGLDKMELKEKDYRKYLIQEYTFLKRPVIIVGKELFAGSAKATVEAAQKALTGIKN